MSIGTQKFSPRLSRPPSTSRSSHLRPLSSPLRLSSIKESPDSSDVDSDDEASGYALPTKITKSALVTECRADEPTETPPHSVLKRPDIKNGDRLDDGSGNRFEISVILYRTSCCATIVRVEHISDWLHESSPDGHCPLCKSVCSFQSHTRLALSPASPRYSSTKPSLPFHPLALFQRLYKSPLPLQPSPTFSSRTKMDSTYTLFNTDDEAYPYTEHSLILGSSLISTDIYEMLIRVTSIAGLTFFLYALLA